MADAHTARTDEQPTPQFAWSNMFVTPEADPRSAGGFSDERSMLVGYLRDYRLTLELKCADLTAEQLARRSVPPSKMSLLGLVRHLAEVERFWFRRVLAGQDVPKRYSPEGERDGAFDDAVGEPAVVEEAWRAWRAEVAFADELVAATADLGFRAAMSDGTEISLRELLLHMVEEYARHCGHADLLRERIDGRVGQ
ncbi:DinB family protein [Micromonospora sp. R77]|uniref:DinB family protein n=1 Tax=Micromonospora sp. R77 TaxID=2925836 RepID=UPI001F615C78|nr:DinB family protein [Micromonospora sp. R77]MCI4064404.1 DinB family protein [Micromonospora sp. R77]